MFEFVILVVLANLTILGCLYVLRHFIAIRAPVLFMAVGISILLCILYPFMVVLLPYPQVFYLYAALILAGAALLSVIESKFLAAEESRQNKNSSPALGDALAAAGGVPAVGAGRNTFYVFGGGNFNQTHESRGSMLSGEPAPVLYDQAAGVTGYQIPPAKPAREEFTAATDISREDMPATEIRVEQPAEEMVPQYPSGDSVPESTAYEETVDPAAGEPGISTIPGRTDSGAGDMSAGCDLTAAGPGEQGAAAKDAGPEEPAGTVDAWTAEPARLFESCPADPEEDAEAGPAELAAAAYSYPADLSWILPEEPVTADIAGDLPAGNLLEEELLAGRIPASPAEAAPPELDGDAPTPEWISREEAAGESPAADKPEIAVQPEDHDPAPAGGPYPGGMAEGPGKDVAPAEGEDIGSLVARSFGALGAGDKFKALEGFFKALKLNPEPRLAAMLCIEISSIYLSEGRRVQALAVMEMLQDVWGPALGEKDSERVKTIIIQLRREAK